jgi:D-3-phosphoglycerate dehydrogenase / 2-oxoglutarate reductase
MQERTRPSTFGGAVPVTVLAAGDHFVLPPLLTDAVRAEVPDAEVRELTLPWPEVPSGRRP